MSGLTTLLHQLRTGERALSDYIDQLETHFYRREPNVLAFLPERKRFERLHREAAALEEKYPNPAQRPLLFGLPVGIKDIFHVDGFETRAGAHLPAAELQGEEAKSVTYLKEAGALILGKTVTTEFAFFAPGPTRNPHHPAHTPGGSSSGSAAAVAAGLCPLALGTQTIGSINRPAAYCGVVGYKPSYDRISRAGVLPLAPSADHVGVLAENVAGLTAVTAVLCKGWHPVTALTRPVLGIPEGPYLERTDPTGLAHFRARCARLKRAGYQLKSVAALPDFEAIEERHHALVAAEAAQVHAAWFEAYGDRYHPKTVELIERGQSVAADALQAGRDGRAALRESLTAVMAAEGIDLWLSPPAPGEAPLGLSSTGSPVMNLPWTHAGLPTLTIPAGLSELGLPLGLQVTGGWYEDEKLLYWGVGLAEAAA